MARFESVSMGWNSDIHSSLFSAIIAGTSDVGQASMYRITLECEGVPASAGDEAARDITEAFRRHYPHEQNVLCTFSDGRLRLVAENDHDPEGLNLMDELSDNISAYIAEPFDGDVRVVSVESAN